MSKGRKVFSGVFIVSVLVKNFDFVVISQRGSHVKLKSLSGGRVTIIPLHKELAPGTLASVLRLAGVERKRFLVALKTR